MKTNLAVLVMCIIGLMAAPAFAGDTDNGTTVTFQNGAQRTTQLGPDGAATRASRVAATAYITFPSGNGQTDAFPGVSGPPGALSGSSASGYASVVGGGNFNSADGQTDTIAGGGDNHTSSGTADFSGFNTIGGGLTNSAGSSITAYANTVAGGAWNAAGNATGSWSNSIGGGGSNIAGGLDASYATVGGGRGNDATSGYATVGGGYNNTASGLRSTVGGGDTNTASGEGATVGGGGAYYSLFRSHGTLGGPNIASAFNSTIGGGGGNTASGKYATVGGGGSNIAGGGGYYGGAYATVGGGRNNTASGYKATIGGGYYNHATGHGATIPGGQNNDADGDFSFAAGWNANDGGFNNVFIWGDNGGGTATASNQFNVHASGGILLNGAVEHVSDRNMKEAFSFVSAREVLDKVVEMPVSTWRFKGEDDSVRHIGPMAQDFKAAFGYGVNDTHITATDADGVALAAIQGLNAKLEDKRAEDAEVITVLRWDNAVLRSKSDALEARLTALEKAILRERGSDAATSD